MNRVLLILSLTLPAAAQEAPSGFELRTTLSGMGAYSHRLSASPRSGNPYSGGARSVFYPTWKISSAWTVSGAIQVHSRPYFFEEFATQGYGVKASILQAHLSYSRFVKDGSVVFRAGQLSSAFGSFLLRYDDAANPLIDMPITYGYYYKGVTTLGLTGAEVDVTRGRVDARAQFVNSSPSNRRSLFDREQYGNWAGGAGVTIRQGFRIGASAFRGPYLHRQHRFFFLGEADPRELPATAYGIDLDWGGGPWNVRGEWQHFEFPYRAIPTFTMHSGYGEVRRVLNPRWYVASRIGYTRPGAFPGYRVYEFAAGYRLSPFQLIKAGYQIQEGPTIRGTLSNTCAIQLVTTFRPISVARD